jgi:hypothetical protein
MLRFLTPFHPRRHKMGQRLSRSPHINDTEEDVAMRPVFVIVCSFLVVGQVSGGKRAIETVEKKAMQDGIVMIVSLPEHSAAGAGLNLTVTLENQSEMDLSFHFRTKYSMYDLRVEDHKGEPVPLTRFGKTVQGRGAREGSGVIARLKPGQRREHTLNLARVFDLTDDGEYTLTVGWPGGKLKTEKITFKRVDEARR